MFELPLHPIAVHFPIALGSLIPILSFITWWTIKHRSLPNKTWYIVILLSLFYFGSALVAKELGERDEDIVEKVVKEALIEEHEEAGERIPWVAGIILFVSLFPLIIRKEKSSIQLATVVVSSMGLIPLIDAGHTGGKLVYVHGAAKAHINKAASDKKSGANIQREK